MKRNLAPETKVAGGGAVGAIITLVLLLNGWQHWFTPPPADVTAALTAALATAVAYWLPHTHRYPPEPPITNAEVDRMRATLTSRGILTPQSAATYSTGTATPGHAAEYKPAAPLPPPASVPPMTSLPPTAAETNAPRPEGTQQP